MTPANHPREEDAAAYAFGQMEAAERIHFVRDMEKDPELQKVAADLMEAAALLSLAAPQSSAPPAVRDFVLKHVASIAQDGRPQAVSRPVPQASAAAFFGWAMAAGFALVACFGWMQWHAVRDTLAVKDAELKQTHDLASQMESTAAAAREHANALQASLAERDKDGESLKQALAAVKKDLSAATMEANAVKTELTVISKTRELDKMQIAMLKSTIADYKQGVAVVVWDSAKQEGVLKLEKMPPLDSNKDYQLWVVDPSKKAPVNAGVVRVNPQGFAKVQFKPTLEIQQADKFALSVEKRVDAPLGVADNAGPIVLLSP